jgi:non-specific serine/threonine protein kinase/serine/threonine-protein kinase
MIKAGMYDEAVVERFQSERQSLAIMEHPAIAKVFDAGTTPEGQPYFVMEYVPGLPITEYCDRKKLTIRDRLELFIETCDGVQHAHQKAIIHRDLKPANILVVEVDGKPVPRIIDFGLAKAVTHLIAGDARKTQFGNLVGTPGYMSPEQADANVQDIDTRSDVYSLGVVLYLLLSGREPLESKLGQKQQLDELLRRLREDEPPRPSTRVSGDRHSSSAIAEARSTEPRQLTRMLRGDLDWITMKALEKDRARRYGAPSDLVADIRRYLNHEPVLARPASAAYRSGKFVKRHKLALAVASVFALMVLAGAVAIVREAQIARMQEARAERRFEALRKLTDSMLFEFHDSIEFLPGSTAARELVVSRALEYLQQIETEANGDPATYVTLPRLTSASGESVPKRIIPIWAVLAHCKRRSSSTKRHWEFARNWQPRILAIQTCKWICLRR